jgi:hypothetical protein
MMLVIGKQRIKKNLEGNGIHIIELLFWNWGAMLQAGRLRVRLPMGSFNFFLIYLILPVALWS